MKTELQKIMDCYGLKHPLSPEDKEFIYYIMDNLEQKEIEHL